MGSSRLPGKVLLPLGGKPALHQVLDRLLQSKKISQIVVATTTQTKDDAIVDALQTYPQIKISRGSEDDVLDRYYQAAKAYGAQNIIRITSDCPLIDPQLLDQMIEKFQSQALDYLSNFFEQRHFPRGLDAEIFTFNALEKAWTEAQEKPQREHVTPYIWQQPQLFNCAGFSKKEDHSQYRWTLDVEEDYQLLSTIFDELGPHCSTQDVLNLMQEKPELPALNAQVEQKKLSA